MAGKAEFTLPRPGKGQLLKVALDAHLHLGGHAFEHAVAHVVAHFGRQGGGQVTVHAVGLGLAELALQVQHARAALRAGLPLAVQRALQVVVGHLQRPLWHHQLPRLPLPAARGVQLAQGHVAVFEPAGQGQLSAMVNVQLGFAAVLGHLQRQTGPADAWPVGAAQDRVDQARGVKALGVQVRVVGRLQAQVLGLQARFVGGGCVVRALPGPAQGRHLAAQALRLQALVPCAGQWQAHGQFVHRLQVQAVALHAALFGLRGRGGLEVHRHIAARPGQACGADEGQVPGRKIPAVGLQLARQPPRHLGQRQGCQVRGQLGLHLDQLEVGRAPRPLAVGDVRPQTQRALPSGHLHAQSHVLAQLRNVDLWKVGVSLAVPVVEASGMGGQQPPVEATHQHKAIAPVGGRCGVDAQRVLACAVAQHHVHLLQSQWHGLGRGWAGGWWGVALWLDGQQSPLGHPAQRAAPHDHFTLRKQPIGGVMVVTLGAAQCQAGDQPLA